MGNLFSGGVVIILISLIPTKDRCSVLGIGVAVRVKTSTSVLISLSRSLWATPNLCSSSITTNPRSLKNTSFCSNLCVPIQISTAPEANDLTNVF